MNWDPDKHHPAANGQFELADTIKRLDQGTEGSAQDIVSEFDDTLTSFLAELESMRNDAEFTHKMVSNYDTRIVSTPLMSTGTLTRLHARLLDLLDLKQKAAALERRTTGGSTGQGHHAICHRDNRLRTWGHRSRTCYYLFNMWTYNFPYHSLLHT